ncbi:MAG: DEAD/DEAH box helicase, partial [Deltaproteobacteria bacterium]
RTWSQGVALARDGRVVSQHKLVARSGDAAGEIQLEVRVPGRPTPFEVTLYVAHGDWECSCESRERACSHVVAGVLAAVAAARDGAGVPDEAARGLAAIRYLLTPAQGGVIIDRALVRKDRTEPLAGSLLSLVGTGKAAGIATTETDLTADRLITARAGAIDGARLQLLLEVLAGARDVRWNGEPITTSREPVVPRVVVDDAPGGAELRIERDPIVRDVVAVGVVRTTDDVLRPIGAEDLSGSRLDRLPHVQFVPQSAFATLLGVTLPELAQRVPIDVRATRLPKLGGREPPRIDFDVQPDGDQLRVLPTLLYGDPPRARVDANTLVHLGGALPIRDLDEERKLTHRLRDELNLVPGRRVELTGKDASAMQAKLAAWLVADSRAASLAKAVPLEPRVAIDGARIDVELSGGGRSAPIAAALRAWQAGAELVPLTGGGWGRLPKSWLDQHGQRLADLLATAGDERRVPIYALPDLGKLCAELDQPPPPELERLRPLLDEFTGIPAVHPEGQFTGELRPYQQRGLDWLAFCRDAGLGCVLADDMGLGKTIQALAVIRGRTLVVSPTSVLFNWLAETRRFRPDLRVATYRGARRSLETDADVVLTSYPLLRNDSDVLAGVTWDTVVLDESQTIKNPDSQVARAAYRLKARWRLTLSGTPIENRLDELWSQLHFTNPGLLGSRTDFQDRWAEPIGLGDAATAARLRERIRPFVLRRMKSEVARDLPPRTDALMYVELDDLERAIYDSIRAATQSEIVALLQAGGGVMAALEALLRLRQAACHTALLPTAVRGGAAAQQSSKTERLLEALEDVVADGHRALVFSQWTSLLDLIEPHLTAADIRFNRLDGSTVDRAGVVAGFQADGGPPVMLLSLKAGGTGLNLTAADHVFLVDPWWNPAVEDQAADRAHRIGQDKPVMVYRMVARDTVEERILELQERKRALADAALADAGGAAAITRDDLLALLA